MTRIRFSKKLYECLHTGRQGEFRTANKAKRGLNTTGVRIVTKSSTGGKNNG